MISLGAKILSLEEIRSERQFLGKVVMTSGGYDPIHPVHISCIQESENFGDTVVVVVNGDSFLTKKKGMPFQDLQTRVAIVSSIKGVDIVVPYETDLETSVVIPLEIIKPDIFTKGGDRVDMKTIPEWDCCQKYGIEIMTNVGFEKKWSSSEFLKSWDRRKVRKI